MYLKDNVNVIARGIPLTEVPFRNYYKRGDFVYTSVLRPGVITDVVSADVTLSRWDYVTGASKPEIERKELYEIMWDESKDVEYYDVSWYFRLKDYTAYLEKAERIIKKHREKILPKVEELKRKYA
jgi:hypothetical protein